MSRSWWILGVLALYGCASETAISGDEEGVSDDDDAEDTDVADTDTGGDTDDPSDDKGKISGIVRVELYTEDENGDRQSVAWDDAYGTGRFPFGDIFVAAYTENGGAITYHDDYVIHAPEAEGSEFTLKVDPVAAPTAYVYAVLDYWGDGILSPSEPLGVWPDAVEVVAGEEQDGLVIPILVPYYNFDAGGGGGGGGGGWDRDNYVLISGTANLTVPYAGGSCVAMWYDQNGLGPYYTSAFTPSIEDDGASAEYGLYVPKYTGTGKLLGAWDSNYNGLIDPADKWGGHVNAEGEDGNPITVATDDLPGTDLEIPFGDGAASVVPFHTVSGTITLRDGVEAYEASTVFYVGAMKWRPDESFTVTDVEAAYDYASFAPADFVDDKYDYTLVVPANTITYLWAYADLDADTVLHEEGEPLGAPENESGKISTGTDSIEGLNIDLTFPFSGE